jgi:serine/threonine protein kinase
MGRPIVDAWPLRDTDPVWVDGYRLVSRLGVGGMADVFYGLAPTGRPVAVKILRAADGANEKCQREYRLAHSLDADCTAPALGHGMSTAGAYLVTTYLSGYRCGTTLLRHSTPPGPLWTLGSALARVLAAIHAKGIVHCDVKPSNLLVRGHDVRVIDFGIARYVGEPCADGGIVHCTRGWAAPEQLRTGPATPAIDILRLGMPTRPPGQRRSPVCQPERIGMDPTHPGGRRRNRTHVTARTIPGGRRPSLKAYGVSRTARRRVARGARDAGNVPNGLPLLVMHALDTR